MYPHFCFFDYIRSSNGSNTPCNLSYINYVLFLFLVEQEVQWTLGYTMDSLIVFSRFLKRNLGHENLFNEINTNRENTRACNLCKFLVINIMSPFMFDLLKTIGKMDNYSFLSFNHWNARKVHYFHCTTFINFY